MTKRDSTKVLWRVQVKAKTGSWLNKGTFETRKDAREKCHELRGNVWVDGYVCYRMDNPGYGFGNTRVVRLEKA